MTIFSLNTARQIVASTVAAFGLGCVFSLAAPLVMGPWNDWPAWSWSRVAEAFPYAMALACVGMMYEVVAEWISGHYAVAKVKLIPLIAAGAALLAGAALFIETPLVQLLSPWIQRRDLPSIVFAVPMTVLAVAVTKFADPHIDRFKRATGGWAFKSVQQVVVLLVTAALIFAAHIAWLDGLRLVSRIPSYDPSFNMLEIAGKLIFLPLAIGVLVGFCLRHALSPAPAPLASCSDMTLGIGAPHDYQWFDFAPRRPYHTVYDERVRKGRLIMMAYAATGFAAGAVAGRDSWMVSGLCGAVLGLILSSLGVMLVNRTYRHKDPDLLVSELVQRRAYIEDSGDTLMFVVITEDGSSAGHMTLRTPWETVQSFVDGTYGKMVASSDMRLFRDIDWNVIMAVPDIGAPKLVAETFAGQESVYRTLSQLNERFGAAARSSFMRKRDAASRTSGGGTGSGVPAEL